MTAQYWNNVKTSKLVITMKVMNSTGWWRGNKTLKLKKHFIKLLGPDKFCSRSKMTDSAISESWDHKLYFKLPWSKKCKIRASDIKSRIKNMEFWTWNRHHITGFHSAVIFSIVKIPFLTSPNDPPVSSRLSTYRAAINFCTQLFKALPLGI